MCEEFLTKYKDCDDEFILKDLCIKDNLPMLQWFYSTDHTLRFKKEEIIFLCEQGKIDTIKWIYSVQKEAFENLNFENHRAFRNACKNNHLSMGTFLQSIDSRYKMTIEDNSIKEYWVENDINLCVFYDTPTGLEVKTLLNTQELRIEKSDELLKKISSIDIEDMKSSTYSKCGSTMFDKEIRDSYVFEKIKISLENTDLIKQLAWGSKEMILVVGDYFDCIKYSVGGKFDWHRDSQQFEEHNYTVLIYPPQSITGGELIVKSSTNNKKIKMSEHLWKIVMMPLGASHCSKEVITGTKITLKGTGYVREKENTLKRYYDSGSEQELDGSGYRMWCSGDDDW
jgi:hypothetical protein